MSHCRQLPITTVPGGTVHMYTYVHEYIHTHIHTDPKNVKILKNEVRGKLPGD